MEDRPLPSLPFVTAGKPALQSFSPDTVACLEDPLHDIELLDGTSLFALWKHATFFFVVFW